MSVRLAKRGVVSDTVSIPKISGRLTQRLECHPHTVEVAGSNPAPPIPKLFKEKELRILHLGNNQG